MNPKPLEPGCRALIINSVVCPENIGKIVTVLRLLAPGEIIKLPTSENIFLRHGPREVWLIESLGQPLAVRVSSPLEDVKILSPIRGLRADFLRRLDDFEPDESLFLAEDKKTTI